MTTIGEAIQKKVCEFEDADLIGKFICYQDVRMEKFIVDAVITRMNELGVPTIAEYQKALELSRGVVGDIRKEDGEK